DADFLENCLARQEAVLGFAVDDLGHHHVAGGEGEVLEVLLVLALELGHGVAQRKHPEADVARLILHDVFEQFLEQLVLGIALHETERRDRQSLGDDLHPDVLRLPTIVLQDCAQEALEGGIDRVDAMELGDVLAKAFHVTRFVEGLSGRVHFRVEVRHRVNQLSADHQRALLAVQELREPPRGELAPELELVLFAERSIELGLEHRHHGHVQNFLLDRAVPVDCRRDVPLIALGVLVQPVHLRKLHAVVPVENAFERRADNGAVLSHCENPPDSGAPSRCARSSPPRAKFTVTFFSSAWERSRLVSSHEIACDSIPIVRCAIASARSPTAGARSSRRSSMNTSWTRTIRSKNAGLWPNTIRNSSGASAAASRIVSIVILSFSAGVWTPAFASVSSRRNSAAPCSISSIKISFLVLKCK